MQLEQHVSPWPAFGIGLLIFAICAAILVFAIRAYKNPKIVKDPPHEHKWIYKCMRVRQSDPTKSDELYMCDCNTWGIKPHGAKYIMCINQSKELKSDLDHG